MEKLVVEFFRRFGGDFVIKLSSLGLNNIRFTWRDAICLRVITFSNLSRDSFFVVPSRIFQLHKSLCWWLMLSVLTWSKIAIHQLFVTLKPSSKSCTSLSSCNKLIHKSVEFILNIFGFLLNVFTLYSSISNFTPQNGLEVADSKCLRDIRWKRLKWSNLFDLVETLHILAIWLK